MRLIPLTRRVALMGTAIVGLSLAGWSAGAMAEEVLKIGVLGVMSGPAASWGLTNKYCAEATANMYNAKGGVDIGGEKYKIEIVLPGYDTYAATLDLHAGHVLNWYDTSSLEPLAPRYVSTVDSGNLAGHLLTLNAGLLELVAARTHS